MGNVAVLGVGLHRFGKFEESASEISRKAVEMALEDAGMEWREVQAVVAGSPRLSAGGFGFGLNGNEMESSIRNDWYSGLQCRRRLCYWGERVQPCSYDDRVRSV